MHVIMGVVDLSKFVKRKEVELLILFLVEKCFKLVTNLAAKKMSVAKIRCFYCDKVDKLIDCNNFKNILTLK